MPELVAALQYYTMRFFIDCKKKGIIVNRVE
jgi:hypothetical protein